MICSIFLVFHFWLIVGVVYANDDHFNHLLKRDDNGYSCTDQTSILCPLHNTVNSAGLNTLEVLYFGLQNTSLPDSTLYSDGGKVICIGHKSGPTIDITAGAGYYGLSAGVNFNVTIPGTDDGSICIFPQGGNITLADAKGLIDTLIKVAQCKVCGWINIDYTTNATNSSGGILKSDYTTHDNCIDTCVGPLSYKNTTATATASHSAGRRLGPPGMFRGGLEDWLITLVPVALAIAGSSIMFLQLG